METNERTTRNRPFYSMLRNEMAIGKKKRFNQVCHPPPTADCHCQWAMYWKRSRNNNFPDIVLAKLKKIYVIPCYRKHRNHISYTDVTRFWAALLFAIAHFSFWQSWCAFLVAEKGKHFSYKNTYLSFYCNARAKFTSSSLDLLCVSEESESSSNMLVRRLKGILCHAVNIVWTHSAHNNFYLLTMAIRCNVHVSVGPNTATKPLPHVYNYKIWSTEMVC